MLEVSCERLNLKSSIMSAAMLFGLGDGVATMSNLEANAMKRITTGYGKQGISNLTRYKQRPTTTQPVEATNSTQNETPPSNDHAKPQNTEQHTSESQSDRSEQRTDAPRDRPPHKDIAGRLSPFETSWLRNIVRHPLRGRIERRLFRLLARLRMESAQSLIYN